MNRGMMLPCGGCSFTRSIDLNGSAGEIESRINETMEEGWRYIKKWGEFICPACARKGLDPLYLKCYGPPQIGDKLASYKALVERVAIQLRAFMELEAFTGERREL